MRNNCNTDRNTVKLEMYSARGVEGNIFKMRAGDTRGGISIRKRVGEALTAQGPSHSQASLWPTSEVGSGGDAQLQQGHNDGGGETVLGHLTHG